MHLKRLVLIGAAAIAACGVAFLSNAGPVPAGGATAGTAGMACGLGPAPGAPDFAAYQAQREADVAREGFERVCDADLARYDIGAGLRPLPLALAGLDFQPLDLAATPVARYTSLGGLAEAMHANGASIKSRLYRAFRLPDGHTLTLFEHDMSADGSSSWRDPGDEPERINGLPARLVVLQGESGKAVSVLSWKEGRRMIELRLDANVVREQRREQLFALAASLPRSVAARPDLPEHMPAPLGPDGRPVREILPAVVAVGGAEARMPAPAGNRR